MTHDLLERDLRVLGAIDAPLLVLLHGRAHGMEVMSLFLRILPPTWNVLFLQAPNPDRDGGWCWWDSREADRGAAKGAEVAPRVAATVEHCIKSAGLAPAEVLAMGFSQGAAMIAILLQLHPGFFSRAVLVAGFVPKVELSGVTPRGLPPVLMLHGSEDAIIPLEWAEQGRDYLQNLGFPVSWFIEPVGHKAGVKGMRFIREWLA